MKYFKEIIIILIVVVFLCLGLLHRNKFKNNYKLTKGIVNSIEKTLPKGAGNYCVFYSFYINNKRFTNDNCYNYCGELNLDKVRNLIINKEFLVAYFDGSESSNKILITESDYNFFSIKMIDSLKVYDSILNCK